MSESKELAQRQSGGGQLVEAAASGDRHAQTLLMVREAMLNPDVDAEKAKVMAELMTSLEDRAMAAEFNRDFNAALFEMPVITKGGIIKIPANQAKGTPERTQGRFARFEDIDRVVRPILQRHNLAIRFEVGSEPSSAVTVRPILSHANGHTERGEAMKLPRDESGAKNAVQGTGSAVSYGKRYAMCAALNIITEGSDDDGSLGKFAIDMPHERQVAVLEMAEEAAEAGVEAYRTWFDGQGVKDRSWLVSEGHHERLGGVTPVIEGPKSEPRPDPAPAARTRPAADPPPADDRPTDQGESATGKHDVTTPAGWTAQFKEDCAAAETSTALGQLAQRSAGAMAKLAEHHPKLFDEAQDALQVAQDRLAGEGSGEGKGDLFGGESS